jgi:hypothetical protein
MRMTLASASLGAALLLSGCTSHDDQPTLTQSVEWMRNALAQHNGQRLDENLSKENLVAKLSSDGCKLNYELTEHQMVEFDLSDVDPKTIAQKQIGNGFWVTFDARDFHKSIHYKHGAEVSDDYDATTGGFSLDSPEVAKSFAQALQRAVQLCGGKPSTF